MGFMKSIAGAGGFGLAGLAATKKISPLAAISPAAALIKGSKKKSPAPENGPVSFVRRSDGSTARSTSQII